MSQEEATRYEAMVNVVAPPMPTSTCTWEGEVPSTIRTEVPSRGVQELPGWPDPHARTRIMAGMTEQSKFVGHAKTLVAAYKYWDFFTSCQMSPFAPPPRIDNTVYYV